jgi:hypothetical protein
VKIFLYHYILKRGYTVTYKDEKPVGSIKNINISDELYLKFLIEHFEDRVDYDASVAEDLPKGYMKLAYQIDAVNEGLSKIKKHSGFFLSDVVGLGKTITSAMIVKRLCYQTKGQILIIAPPSIEKEWNETFKEFQIGSIRKFDFKTYGALEKIKDSNDYNLISAWSKNDEQKSEIKNSIDDSSLASILGHIQSKFVWFIIPGFDSVYQKIYQFFSNIAGLDPTAQQMEKSDSSISGAISTAKYFLAGAAAGPLGLLGAGIMSVLSSFCNFVLGAITSALQYGILMYLSLIVAVFIFTMMVTSLILIVVASA